LLHFAKNQASAQVTVLVKGDTLVEPDETFFVNLSSPSGATISDGQGQGTIVNDDAPPGSVTLVPDPCFPGKTALQVTGTINSDKIELTNDHGNVKVKLNGKNVGTFVFDGSILVYAGGGNDQVTLDHAIKNHTALVFGELLAEAHQPFSKLRTFEPMPQILINQNVGSKPPLDTLPKYQAALNSAERDLEGSGRILVRYSGTEDKVRVMVEGRDEAKIKKIAEELRETLQREIG